MGREKGGAGAAIEVGRTSPRRLSLGLRDRKSMCINDILLNTCRAQIAICEQLLQRCFNAEKAHDMALKCINIAIEIWCS